LYHNKGWLLHLLGRYKEAVICFHKALELDSNRVEAVYSLGDAYLRLGQREKALLYFQAAAGQVKGKSGFIYREILKSIENAKR